LKPLDRAAANDDVEETEEFIMDATGGGEEGGRNEKGK
jgi:hypothetical protein